MIDASYLTHSPAARQWQRITLKHHHGIAIPLFSIHSTLSHGIGEFTDLPLLIDWCASIGFDVIQLLPLNDTDTGSSPYSAISAFALNPLFIGLATLPYVHDHPFLSNELKALPQFSYVPQVDYSRVRESKENFLRHYFQWVGPQLMKSDDFEKFKQATEYWLKSYAVFKILRNRHHKMSWETWPEAESQVTPQLIETIAQEEENEFNWICFVQFLCYQQLKAAKKYASDKKVFLMGDIPILIDRDSADVWLHREMFDLNYSAGAPPDFFSEIGQNWGSPIYQWKVLADQNYQWWIERLRWADRFYHLYRIDHIVGFFRIWAIPLGLTGKDGQFVPKDETIWIDHGQKIMLMMLNACEMLPIGEDLGVIPPEVRTCLSALGICGTKVMRWEREWQKGKNFISPSDYPVVSMTTVSTHDTETLQQWWTDNSQEAQLFAQFKGWSYQPLLSREHHREILWDSHHSASLFHINPLQEYLALIPGLSWPNPEDERINVPGSISPRNWSYRMRPTLEELDQQSSLKYLMQELIK
jgi:4-alpha-glucanotransferase